MGVVGGSSRAQFGASGYVDGGMARAELVASALMPPSWWGHGCTLCSLPLRHVVVPLSRAALVYAMALCLYKVARVETTQQCCLPLSPFPLTPSLPRSWSVDCHPPSALWLVHTTHPAYRLSSSLWHTLNSLQSQHAIIHPLDPGQHCCPPCDACFASEYERDEERSESNADKRNS